VAKKIRAIYAIGICVIRGVKIGKILVKNQPKTLIPQSKNQIFQKFLTHFPKTSYEQRATRNGYIFVSNVQLRLIIEGVFFYPQPGTARRPKFVNGK